MTHGTTHDIDDTINEINMSQRVDVMLVLLVSFIITAPVMKNAANINLSRGSSQRQDTAPDTAWLTVHAQGTHFLNDLRIDEPALPELFNAGAVKNPRPNLRIRSDRFVHYERTLRPWQGAASWP